MTTSVLCFSTDGPVTDVKNKKCVQPSNINLQTLLAPMTIFMMFAAPLWFWRGASCSRVWEERGRQQRRHQPWETDEFLREVVVRSRFVQAPSRKTRIQGPPRLDPVRLRRPPGPLPRRRLLRALLRRHPHLHKVGGQGCLAWVVAA